MDTADSDTAAPGAAKGAEVDATLPPLAELLDDTEHFRTSTNANGVKRIHCNWCGLDMSNVTKLLHHVNLVKKQGVKVCTANIPKPHKQRYFALYEKKMGAKNRRSGKYFNYFIEVLLCINICVLTNNIIYHLFAIVYRYGI